MAGIYVQTLEIESELTDFVSSDENAAAPRRSVFPNRLTLIGAACGTLALAFVTLLYPSGSEVTTGSAVISEQAVCADDQTGYRKFNKSWTCKFPGDQGGGDCKICGCADNLDGYREATGQEQWTCKYHAEKGGCNQVQRTGKNVMPSEWCYESCGICAEQAVCADDLAGYRTDTGNKGWTCKFHGDHGGCDVPQKTGNNVVPSKWCRKTCGICGCADHLDGYREATGQKKWTCKYHKNGGCNSLQTTGNNVLPSEWCFESCGICAEQATQKEMVASSTKNDLSKARPIGELSVPDYVQNTVAGRTQKIDFGKFPGTWKKYDYKDCNSTTHKDKNKKFWEQTWADPEQLDGWYWYYPYFSSTNFQYTMRIMYKCEKLPKGRFYEHRFEKKESFDADTYWWNYYETWYYKKNGDSPKIYWKAVTDLSKKRSRNIAPGQK